MLTLQNVKFEMSEDNNTTFDLSHFFNLWFRLPDNYVAVLGNNYDRPKFEVWTEGLSNFKIFYYFVHIYNLVENISYAIKKLEIPNF